MASSATCLTLVLAASLLPYFINLGTSALWDANESLYAETAREMIEGGDFLAPTFNYQPRTHKPPLTYWLIALSCKAFGIGEYSVRLPGALAAVGVAFFTFGLARTLFDTRAGLVAAIIAATTPRIFLLARRLPIDILLLFFLMGTACFLARGIRLRSRGSWAMAYLFAGLGFLTKGPIALAIPGTALLVWLFWRRKELTGGVHPWMGLLILSAVIAPWYVLIYQSRGWTYISTFFTQDNWGRFFSGSFGPSRGALFYFPVYFADFFPWSLLSAAALLVLWRRRVGPGSPVAPSYGFPLAWFLSTLVFFSLSRNKQDYYIAPVYPMVAVIIGGALNRASDAGVSEDSDARQVWTGTFRWLAVIGMVLSALPAFVLRSVFPDPAPVLHYAPSGVFLAASAVLAWSAGQRSVSACFRTVAISLAAAYVLFCATLLPALESRRPVKQFCRAIEAVLRPGDEAGYFQEAVPSMIYYLRRPIFEEYDADAMVRRFESDERVFCILTEKNYDYFVGRRDLILYVLDRRPKLAVNLRAVLNRQDAAEQELLLVSNKPSPETGVQEGRETS